jgi:hypothetical protein
MTTTKKLLVLLALVAGACSADDASGIRISGRAAPQDEASCRFDAGGEFQLGEGVLDVGPLYQAEPSAMRYNMFVYVRNTLADPAQSSNAAPTTGKSWYAERVDVRAEPTGLPALTRRYAVPSYEVPVGGSIAQDVTLVDRDLATQLGAGLADGQVRQVLFKATLEGVTGDGERLDSNEWLFVMRVCNGCLPPPTCAPGQEFGVQGCGAPGQDFPPACVGTATPTP